MRDVKNVELSDNSIYTGQLLDDKDIPNGMGTLKSSDRLEKGHFLNGKLDGVAMINTKEICRLGYIKEGVFDGWGLRAMNGEIRFGVLKDKDILVDLTPLVDVFINEMLCVTKQHGWKLHRCFKEGYIFFGIPQLTHQGRMGFHFMGDGNVFLGLSDHDCNSKSGYFLHFDTNYNISRGRFENGVLVKEMSPLDFICACPVSASHAYFSFDTSMNYKPSSFFFNQLLPLHIFEIGSTNEFYYVRTGIGILDETRFTCKRGGYDSTVFFAFPPEEKYKNRLLELNNNPDGFWTPDFAEYCLEFIYNMEQDNTHLPLYKHKSFWKSEEDISDLSLILISKLFNTRPTNNLNRLRMMCEDGNYLRLIPNYNLKRSQLFERWEQGGVFENSSPRDYVYSVASYNENFFEWLFDNPQFHNCRQWNLPYEESEAFNQFLDLFFDLEP